MISGFIEQKAFERSTNAPVTALPVLISNVFCSANFKIRSFVGFCNHIWQTKCSLSTKKSFICEQKAFSKILRQVGKTDMSITERVFGVSFFLKKKELHGLI